MRKSVTQSISTETKNEHVRLLKTLDINPIYHSAN